MPHFILMVMFFVTPPTLGDNRAWALQSTQSAEFDSWAACDDLMRNHLIFSAQTTDTVSVFGWCAPKDANPTHLQQREKAISDIRTAPADKAISGGAFAKSRAALQDEGLMGQYGSCYSYVPAPVDVTPTEKRPSKVAKNIRQVLGSCATRP